MLNTLSKLRERRAKGDKGFTLIELLVVVVILGILIAIAIPLYLNYRRGANDSAAKSDLRNAINVLEQCNTDNNSYPPSVPSTGGAITTTTPVTPPGCSASINLSNGTTLNYYTGGTTPNFTSYIMTATNASGAGKIYCYANGPGGGGAVKTTAAAITKYSDTCPA